jgi:hypothetical protein
MGTEDANRRIAAASALALFTMLWLPLGQIDFMTWHWMKVGTFAAPFLLLAYFSASPRSPSLSDPLFMSVVLLIAYIAHQFEEHWVDLLGNEYAFHDYINALIRDALGSTDGSVAPLTPLAIYVINTSLVWLVGVISIVYAKSHRFALLALASITLINGITHIIAGIINLTYNPGLLTSVLFFMPLSVAYFRVLLKREPDSRNGIIAGLVWALLAHVLMVAGMLAANLFGVIAETVYFVLLVLWSVLPLALFRGANR